MTLRRLTTITYFLATSLAALCYLGAIRSSAVWSFILTGIVITAIATLVPRNPTSYAGLISGLSCGMMWAVIVNSLSGENLGPVARSTTTCIIGVTLVVFGWRRREPNTSVIGHLLILFGALYYGAANEVWKLALVASVFQLAGYVGATAETQRRQPQPRSRREYLLLLILFLAGISIILSTPWRLPSILQRDNPQLSPLVNSAGVTPPWDSSKANPDSTPTTAQPLKTTTTTTVTTKPQNTTTTTTTPNNATTLPVATTTTTTTKNTSTPTTPASNGTQKKEKEKDSQVLFWILLCILAVIFATLIRLLYVRVMNRSLLRKYSTDENRESVRLAWNWTLTHLVRYGYSIAPSVSVDRVATSEQVSKWPLGMQSDMIDLSALAQIAIFSNEPMSEDQKDLAWLASAHLILSARIHSSRFRRSVVPFVRVRL